MSAPGFPVDHVGVLVRVAQVVSNRDLDDSEAMESIEALLSAAGLLDDLWNVIDPRTITIDVDVNAPTLWSVT